MRFVTDRNDGKVNVYGIDPTDLDLSRANTNWNPDQDNEFVFQVVLPPANLGAFLSGLISGDTDPGNYERLVLAAEAKAAVAEWAESEPTNPNLAGAQSSGGILGVVPVSQDDPPAHGSNKVAMFQFAAKFVDDRGGAGAAEAPVSVRLLREA